jgi:hypothetical protein
MRWTDPDMPGTMVWFAVGASPLASIVSLRGIANPTTFSRFVGRASNLGVLAVYEDQLSASETVPAVNPPVVTLLTPLMIWYHAGTP